jgi:hypothetical protein
MIGRIIGTSIDARPYSRNRRKPRRRSSVKSTESAGGGFQQTQFLQVQGLQPQVPRTAQPQLSFVFTSLRSVIFSLLFRVAQVERITV